MQELFIKRQTRDTLNEKEWQQVTTTDNEWQRTATGYNEWYNDWQQLATSGTMSDDEWQWMTPSDSGWQQMTRSVMNILKTTRWHFVQMILLLISNLIYHFVTVPLVPALSSCWQMTHTVHLRPCQTSMMELFLKKVYG